MHNDDCRDCLKTMGLEKGSLRKKGIECNGSEIDSGCGLFATIMTTASPSFI